MKTSGNPWRLGFIKRHPGTATQAYPGTTMAPPPHAPRPGSHLAALDAVRGLAILLVTGFRFSQGPEPSSLLGQAVVELLRLGERGVDLFFVLSGFLITGILFDAKADRHFFRNFYMRRALRIFPLYYGVLFVVVVFLPLAAPWVAALYAQSSRDQGWLWLYGTNFLLAWNESWLLDGFSHFWSLAVEEHFYLVWPLVIFFLSRRAAMSACVVCIVVAVSCRTPLHWSGHYVAVEVLTLCRLDVLAIGAWIALAVRGPGGVRSLVPWARWVAAGSAVFLVGLFGRDKGVGGLGHTLYPCFFGAVILLAITTAPAGPVGRFWNSPVLRFFGKYCYGWYVFQGLLYPLLFLALPPEDLAVRFGSPLLGRVLFILWGASLSLAVALLSWHLYEKHFLKLKDLFAAKERKTL
jgi:peptidoglycan/LPS O-acetylase OafA/YrhL